MKKDTNTTDKPLLWIMLFLVTTGIIFFVSASLGILNQSTAKFYGILKSQFVLGLIGGLILLWVTYNVHYLIWRKYSFYIFLATLLCMLVIFIPGVGYEHGGAKRWINLGFASFQPAELLKFGFILYAATWFSWLGKKVKDLRFSTIPLFIMFAIAGVLLILQPDTKSLVLIIISGGMMLFVSGTPMKHIMLIGFSSVLIILSIGFFTPYIRERVTTFLDPSHDPRGTSYQIQQSLIAIGSGGVWGRGVGQSIQKFGYLPEPQGDSIFAIISEETGFIGTTFIVLLYLAFLLRGIRIAYYAPDRFARLFVVGSITMIWFQTFLNIASITNLIPLTGVPLVFMSHGGTSLMISMAMVGIVLNISKFQKEEIKD